MRQEAPWEILGISENATEEEIQEARRRNLGMFHPDKFPQATARQKSIVEEESKRINWAADEMLRRLRAQRDASYSSQPPPRDTQEAPYTTHNYQANEPPLGAMENLQMLIATVGLKRILQIIAVITPMALGFFHGLYGLERQSPNGVINTNSNPGGAVSNSNNSNSPAQQLIDLNAKVLKQPYGDLQFEVPQARVEEDRLIISMTIQNTGRNKVLMKFSMIEDPEAHDRTRIYLPLDQCARCEESKWPKYILEKAVVNGKTDQALDEIQDVDGNKFSRFLPFEKAQEKLEFVYSIYDTASLLKAKKLSTFDLSIESSSQPSASLSFRNIPVNPPDPNARILSLNRADTHFELQTAHINLEDDSLVIPLAITYVGQDQSQRMWLDLRNSLVAVTDGENGETCRPLRMQFPDGEEVTHFLTYHRGEETKVELVCTNLQSPSIYKTKKLKTFDLRVEVRVAGNFVDLHFKNIPVIQGITTKKAASGSNFKGLLHRMNLASEDRCKHLSSDAKWPFEYHPCPADARGWAHELYVAPPPQLFPMPHWSAPGAAVYLELGAIHHLDKPLS